MHRDEKKTFCFVKKKIKIRVMIKSDIIMVFSGYVLNYK